MFKPTSLSQGRIYNWVRMGVGIPQYLHMLKMLKKKRSYAMTGNTQMSEFTNVIIIITQLNNLPQIGFKVSGINIAICKTKINK